MHTQEKDINNTYLDVSGSKIFYEEIGIGPPLVLLHDGLVHHVVWNAQFKVFADHYRVIRYDRRGYGLSEYPTQPYSNVQDLKSLLDHLGIERTMLFGISGGGEVAIDFALAFPNHVNTLVLVGAVISGYEFSEHFLNRNNLNFEPLFRGDRQATIQNWINDPYITLEKNVKARSVLREILTGSDVKLYKNAAIANFAQPPALPAIERLSEVQARTLIIVGESDIADVHAHAGVLEVFIPKAKRVVVPNAGHLVNLEQADKFNQIVLDFLNKSRSNEGS